MHIEIQYDKKHGYTATIKELGIITEGDTFDDLIYNINESLELNQDSTKPLTFSQTNFQFNLFSKMHAINI